MKTQQTIKLKHATERYNLRLSDSIKNAQNNGKMNDIECNQSHSPALSCINHPNIKFLGENLTDN